jgi:hypothetical protein
MTDTNYCSERVPLKAALAGERLGIRNIFERYKSAEFHQKPAEEQG